MSDDWNKLKHLVDLSAENTRLKAEVERLRNAGDAMADAIEIYRGWIRLPGDEPLREAFNRVIEAMKEGKPSV